MGVIVGGQSEDIPGIATRSWLDDPKLRLSGEDERPRSTKWIRSVVLHTTKGIPAKIGDPPQPVLPGLGPHADVADRIARLWSTDGRAAGAHLAVDHDGTVSCHADLQADAAYHAGAVNNVSIGIEIYQGATGELYAGQLEAVVALVDWLTRRFGIQRQMPDRYTGAPIQRLEAGASDFVGVFGHRHCSGNRGPGDPGDAVFEDLALAGYERFDVGGGADLAIWRARQAEAGVEHPDGIPGPGTRAALAARGRPHGLWVPRPGDA